MNWNWNVSNRLSSLRWTLVEHTLKPALPRCRAYLEFNHSNMSVLTVSGADRLSACPCRKWLEVNGVASCESADWCVSGQGSLGFRLLPILKWFYVTDVPATKARPKGLLGFFYPFIPKWVAKSWSKDHFIPLLTGKRLWGSLLSLSGPGYTVQSIYLNFRAPCPLGRNFFVGH